MNHLNADGHRHSTDLTAQVFLAYAAEDGPGATRPELVPATATLNALSQLLNEAQITYWECPQPWPKSVDPESAISRAAESCDNYLLVLTPRSLVDTLCLQGLLFALSMNKRIVPVLAETVPADRLPEPLQTLEAIDLRSSVSPLAQTAAGRQLVQTLHHEADNYQTHTQLLVKALRWERQQRDPTLLLQGEDLAAYQRWLTKANRRSQPQPIQLQTLYVAESARCWGDRGDAVTQGTGWLKRWLA
ncbi:toll/interleukin-1 receptor domain-containing protein [Nodosilinea sp. LEGE 06152]|uniref:toll/interleukin-1 receptor domain-containing protein n=1 Tax=Nodosilinea sp. LEGE 06152 TaxID=2777966 RepID=UPI00187EE827|nr:toll/interleukin-1 receptor domain-containing protein [Nodosilinea sp. LEGE 06152]MBE9155282.1 toll/interleukin-1 receptor domain-containing protein [Nodosilinea sp. LEGE 06152]